MHHYSLSARAAWVMNPGWRPSMEKAKIRRIELCLFDTQNYETSEPCALELLQEMQAEKTIDIASIHMPWDIPYWSLDEDTRRQGAADLLKYMKFASVLKAKNYTLHASFEPVKDEDRKASIEAARRTLSDLMPFLQEQGASANVEILPRSCIGRRPEELLEIVEAFPEAHAGICFDVNHLCGCPELLPSYIDMCSDRIRTFHLSDYDGINECHWYPGEGLIDWPAVMAAVNRIKQDVILDFEVGGVQVPSWQRRDTHPSILIRNAEKCAFFLEHAAELCKRENEFILP